MRGAPVGCVTLRRVALARWIRRARLRRGAEPERRVLEPGAYTACGGRAPGAW